jgi:superfamily II DNA/RNA helicase
MKLFIHRSGRTARAGSKGTSYCLLTNAELAYMHDLSIFVGRKYYDRASTDDLVEELLENPQKVCFLSFHTFIDLLWKIAIKFN